MPEFLNWLIPVGVGFAALLLVVVFLLKIYRVAEVDKALIITGGKKPVVKVSGGGFVIPIFRKHSYFDLCMLTVPADSDEIKTKTSVPIVVDWTAQIRPDAENPDNLMRAIMSFKERGSQGIINDVKLTLMGGVRDVVASMTPEDVLMNKEAFKKSVEENVVDEMQAMGLKLVSLNIQDITDNNGYYDNIAAKDIQEKRLSAESVKAQADQQVRERVAESDKIATQAELDSELSISEKTRDKSLREAEFKQETDRAQADAEVAGKLQMTIRQKEIAAEEGQVAVVRQEQANLAAQKEADVIKTRANAEKTKKIIESEAESQSSIIQAEADAEVVKKSAEGRAQATKIEAEATAERISREGQAEADVIKQKGLAEAETEKAKLLAKAEGEKALAEARASNDQVNFEIEKLKIDAQARIEIATNTAKIMADLGKNAEFVNIGSNGSSDNVLMDTLGGIPTLLKKLDVTNRALSSEDKSFNEEISDLVTAIATPLKGLGLLSAADVDSNTEVNQASEPRRLVEKKKPEVNKSSDGE